jgi:aspartate aminotransferase-like enzyme
MEAAVRNGAAGRVLSLVHGAFSERFADIARACGRQVDVYEVPWGEAHDPTEVARRLAGRAYDAVTVVHSETSTGVLEPLEAIASAVAEHPETLLLVDSVTGIGGVEVRTDAWGLDFVLTGSQKAMALPPGLAFGVASVALMARAPTVPDRGVYFDLVLFMENLEKGQTPNTPALSLMYALEAQLRSIEEEGVEARWERHRAMARSCWEWVEAMRTEEGLDLHVLAGEPHRSPTVTCIRLPDGLTGPDIVRGMKERGFAIGGGYGRLKEGTIRIGHMGDHTVAELRCLLDVLRGVMTGA